MNISQKKVILTGARGLIGKESIEELIGLGYEVFALTSARIEEVKGNATQKNLHFISCDIFDDIQLQEVFRSIKPSHLLHFAWCTTGDYLSSDLNLKYRDASLKMLEYFHEFGGKKAVFAGTCFEYEFKDSPLKETDPVNPTTLYAQTKVELCQSATTYCDKHKIQFGWGRIFYVFGHQEEARRLTPHLIHSLSNNKVVTIQTGSFKRDYLYAKDIANGFVHFLDSDVSGIINICSGHAISLENYAKTFAQKLGKMEYLIINQEESSQPKIIVGDTTKLLQEVGYEFKYTLDEAIDNVINDVL